MTPNDQILAEIDEFLALSGVAPTIFGLRAIGDPNLVRNLKAGRELRLATLSRLRAFMEVRETSAA